ncbi:extracellular solute-binding protein [Sphaerisporangium aureirubrum]|uniref:Extracellular solute-binding protein n=1 Tax=Sphaerisporangium aureirubrum TaxID=1544736 RepID=A0ABW1NLX5_9ACTN
MRRRRYGLTALLAAAAVVLPGCASSGDGPAGTTAPVTPVTPRAGAVSVPGPAASARRTTAAPPTPATTPTPSPSPTKTIGPGEGSVTVLAPRGYAEYGGYDPQVNWVGPFERDTGCKVNLRYPPSPGEMDAMARRVTYDVISAPPEVAGRLIAERRAAPITTSLLPHYDDIPRWLRTQRTAVSGDEVYGVPYLWGSYVTLTAGTERGLDAASIFSRPGSMSLRDAPLSIADAALALRTTRPALGVRDPFELTPAQLDAAVALLAERRAERTYWTETVEPLQGLTSGAVSMTRTVPYQQDLLRRAGRPVRAVPQRETTGWVDSWMLAARPASPNCAYRWLDWIGSPDAQRQAATWTGFAPANAEACTGRAARVCDAYRMDDQAWVKKIHFAVRPTRDCGGEDTGCTDYADWTARWRELVPG